MTLSDLNSFLLRKGFKVDPRDGSLVKTVRDMDKRYVIKDNQVFMESKSRKDITYKLVAFSDVREIYVSDNDKLNGFQRYIPNQKG
jgi:hypothetical protein